ncbi:MAG: hypothetical protein A2X80_03150 [Geobacteraceae bacterium GWB2_52_12]|nr:MAG: hypothetical protein A2X80_03150 [Geobacteraceae bacterium GWB2_52_12]
MIGKLLICIGLIACLNFAAGAASATPFTSDFTSDSWQVDPGNPSQVTRFLDEAILTSDANSPLVSLHQTFDFDPSFSFIFKLQWAFTSPDDLISVDLTDMSGNSVLPLQLQPLVNNFADPSLSTGKWFTASIDPAFTGSAGTLLDINFTLADADGINDILKISVDNSSPEPVPEPSTILLMGAGLFGAVLMRFRKTRT